MTIANRIWGTSTIVATLLIGVGAAGQDGEHNKGQEMTMTGCLTKAADVPEHFSFVDQKSGKRWTVTGPADLQKHAANHTVRITGTATAKVFTVSKVEHVSATCEAGKTPEQ